jgi:tryptophan-rich sensory protein
MFTFLDTVFAILAFRTPNTTASLCWSIAYFLCQIAALLCYNAFKKRVELAEEMLINDIAELEMKLEDMK